LLAASARQRRLVETRAADSERESTKKPRTHASIASRPHPSARSTPIVTQLPRANVNLASDPSTRHSLRSGVDLRSGRVCDDQTVLCGRDPPRVIQMPFTKL